MTNKKDKPHSFKNVFTAMLFSLFLLMELNAFSQPVNNNFLNKLEGSWHTKGQAMGLPADINMQWQKTLGDKFYMLQYKMVLTNKDKKEQLFEGVAYYKQLGENEYEATWFDSGGDMHPIKSSSDSSALTSVWGKQGGKYGKTIYRIIDTNTVEIIDAIQLKDGTWREFARNKLVRQ